MTENKENNAFLKHNIGDTLQLQFSPGNADERYYVKLIGYLEDKSILVTTPRKNGAALRIPNEQAFIVRMFSGNAAQGFTAEAIHAASRPYPHLHLSYPEKLESITVRKAERVSCKLIVTVDNEEPDKSFDERKSASMQDISTAGGQLTSPESLGDVGDTITIHSKMTVAGIEQYLKISAKIRRIAEKEDTRAKYEYGVEFVLIDDKDKLILHGFVYEQMMQNTR